MQLTDDLLRHEAGFVFDERRRTARKICDYSTSLRALSPHPTEMMTVRILNVSKGGLKLRAPIMLVPGTLVQIHFQNSIALGEVRYSLSAGSSHDVGVHVNDIFPKQ
jgi:hypothetical protein